MKLMELFSPASEDEKVDDIDWIGDLKFYIDNDESMLEQHIFPAMKRHRKHVGKPGVHKLYINPIKTCMQSYCKKFEIEDPENKFPEGAINELAKHFAQTQEKFIKTGDYQPRKLGEAKENHVTFCFGRMNPPTIGHKQLLDTMASVGGDYKIFVSKTQDKKKNPLDYATKLKFIKAMFPEHAAHVVDEHPNQLPHIATMLYDEGYTSVTFVAGSDRLGFMGPMLQKYNGEENKHGIYKFDSIDIKSSGDREDGVEGVAGVSASNARAAAAEGNFEAFEHSTGAGKLAKPLYDAVRAGMGISEGMTESAKVGDKVTYTSLRSGKRKRTGIITKVGAKNGRTAYELDNGAIIDDSDLSEECAGVGIITKQNTTKDVDKGTIKKNLRKFNL